MITGFEAMALEATDILSASRAAQQITSSLARAGSDRANSSAPVNPSEVKIALDKASTAISLVEKKLVECNSIISSLNSINSDDLHFDKNFPKELKERAELLNDRIENLRDVFSLLEQSNSWKPYLKSVLERKQVAIRAVSRLRNSYLDIAMISEQFVSPVPTIDSDNVGSILDYRSAINASEKLLNIKKSEWM